MDDTSLHLKVSASVRGPTTNPRSRLRWGAIEGGVEERRTLFHDGLGGKASMEEFDRLG